ncbi:hypothetical protein HYS00_03600 [Candidatus Microgenomates bacterium]|nr:hypothetical protein [Candidatus Microgenomates bacterium]
MKKNNDKAKTIIGSMAVGAAAVAAGAAVFFKDKKNRDMALKAIEDSKKKLLEAKDELEEKARELLNMGEEVTTEAIADAKKTAKKAEKVVEKELTKTEKTVKKAIKKAPVKTTKKPSAK